MSRIRSKNTKPELIVRSFLHRNGFRFRLHDKKLPGKPDIVLKKYKTVIFVHGCFWHGHSNCKYSALPTTRRNWWKKKIEGNRKVDAIAQVSLRNKGWKIIEVWTCKLKKKKQEKTLARLVEMMI